MRRSEINHAIRQAEALFDRHGFRLPPFAAWTPQDWRRAGRDADEIRSRRLGWDVTDFGGGRFAALGLTLFTLRNGRLDDPGNRKVYAEKAMMVLEEQVTPWHFHWQKTEDIINRGAGVLVVEVAWATAEDGLAETSVRVACDGVERESPARGAVELAPGQSITLTPRLYHRFYGRRGAGPCLVGEVSSVNDDARDNRFLEALPRFPTMEEDEPPHRLLCTEYPPAV